IVGKLNCDEFAMGSSTENSALGVTRNPWNLDCVPGGSSGGSSVAVAAFECHASLGTDTRASVRLPPASLPLAPLTPTHAHPAPLRGGAASKPPYGCVARCGVMAYASSLDQVGPLARDVGDLALVLEAIAGNDPRDSTSSPRPVPAYGKALEGGVRGLRLGLPR